LSELLAHPAFRDVSGIVPMSGFSGAFVAVINSTNEKTRRVRKSAVDAKGSIRLFDQAKRQMALLKVLHNVAHVPAVLDEGTIEGCYWYDMEFVSGIDAVEYLSIGTRPKVDSFFCQLASILDTLKITSSADEPSFELNSKLNRKLDEIDTLTTGKFHAWTDLLRDTMSETEIYLSPTFSHGDLTLENILVDRSERLWLIDAIPSPFNHYWIDLAKLFQDLEGRWFLHRKRSLSIALTLVLSEKLVQHVVERDAHYLTYHPVLLGMNFARILPYCTGPEDIKFVTNRIELAVASSEKYRSRK